MKSELIIDVSPNDVSIALLEDSRLVSLQKEQRNIAYAVGDIYLAKVKKLMPGLNAAFVNVGYEKDAFLHYLDLGPHFASYNEFVTQLLDDKKKLPSVSKIKLLPDIDKHGSITEQLTPGKQLLVQIVKEPISSKGPRLTTEIAFTGRYMVLMPFCDKISVSQKIKSTEEKLRLRQLIDSIKPKNFGVIIRTSAEGKRVAELNNELKTLIKCWEDALAKAQRSEAPALIFEEESRIVGMLRDVFSPSFEAIYVNDAETFEQIQKYVALIAPERKDIVKLYTKPEPIFDTFAITRQIKSSFGKTVSFKSGSYIIIEHTEALHVIDVNSGNRTKATNDQETNALEVNLRAADEIARQLRLRDMGGIIVVDFIDMAKNEHRQQLYEHMKEIMQGDRARHNILPLSKFGLMQITRQRVRPALDITTAETCPSCFGKGVIQPSLLFTDTLFEKLEYLTGTLNINNFTMYVHPFVEAYIKKGWLLSLYRKWRRTLGVSFKIIADQNLAYLQYRVVDSNGNELNLIQEKDTESSQTSKIAEKSSRTADDTISPDENKPVEKNKPQLSVTAPKAQKSKTKKESEKQSQQKQTKPALNTPTPEPEQTKSQPVVENTPKANNITENTEDGNETQKPSRSARRRARARAAKAAALAEQEAAIGSTNADSTESDKSGIPTPNADSSPKDVETQVTALTIIPQKNKRQKNTTSTDNSTTVEKESNEQKSGIETTGQDHGHQPQQTEE